MNQGLSHQKIKVLGSFFYVALCWMVLVLSAFLDAKEASKFLNESGFAGGLVLHLGSGKGDMTLELFQKENSFVLGFDQSEENLRAARTLAYEKGVSNKVRFNRWDGKTIPLTENFANLVICEDASFKNEVWRVLAPYGTAFIRQGESWTSMSKPYPSDMDHWPQYFYSATGNSVSKDKKVKPPLYHLKWTGSPRWSRHHDVMSSFSACVSAGGRLFYVFDEGNTYSPMLPASWKLIARDAFNGTILWKKDIPKWFPTMHSLKSGPSHLPRRIVATEDKVYVTLSIEAPVSVLDAKTGKVLKTIAGSEGTEEIVMEKESLFLVSDKNENKAELQRYPYSTKAIHVRPKVISKVDLRTEEVVWNHHANWTAPLSTCADAKHLYYFNGKKIVALSKGNGASKWMSADLPVMKKMQSFFGPTVVAEKNRVFYTGGENYVGHVGNLGKLISLNAEDGKTLWESESPPSGYKSPESLFIINGLVWQNDNTGRVDGGDGTPSTGITTAKGLEVGKDQISFDSPDNAYWFHHRCYPAKATEDYLILSRTGVEMVNVKTKRWNLHHWVRGACLYGIMPANGMVYAPPHPCACYIGAKLNGFSALAGHDLNHPVWKKTPESSRLIQGAASEAGYESLSESNDWPMYRQNNKRSGTTSSALKATDKETWRVKLDGNLTPPVAAFGKVVVAQKNLSAVHAFDAEHGKKLWQFMAGGRIDSAPTLYKNRCYFGSTDGYLYCLSMDTGNLIWKYQASPSLTQHMYFEHIESTHPLHGSVLIREDKVYAVAGRSMFVDGGMTFLILDAESGQKIREISMTDKDPKTGEDLQLQHEVLSMPQALNDLLSCDGEQIHMRKQDFDLDGNRLGLRNSGKIYAKHAGRAAMNLPFRVYEEDNRGKGAHIISGTGYLDDSWWHRTYWSYGKNYTSGYNGYYVAGKKAPSGRIMSFDDKGIYAFGRMNQYYKWSKVYEYYLFHRGYDNVEKWGVRVPILVRSMTMSKDKIYAFGPEEVLHQAKVQKILNLPDTKETAQKQDEAFRGEHGATLLVVDRKSGSMDEAYRLHTTPVFDGMISAYQKLYVSLVDGTLMCLGDEGKSMEKVSAKELLQYNQSAFIQPAKGAKKRK